MWEFFRCGHVQQNSLHRTVNNPLKPSVRNLHKMGHMQLTMEVHLAVIGKPNGYLLFAWCIAGLWEVH